MLTLIFLLITLLVNNYEMGGMEDEKRKKRLLEKFAAQNYVRRNFCCN